MTCGIYKITNLVNGKCYVGRSRFIELRVRGHLKGRGSSHLARAVCKHGKDSFVWEILGTCAASRDKLVQRNQQGHQASEETKAKMSTSQLARYRKQHEEKTQ